MNNEHMNPTQRVLDALEECGNHATRSGKGWSARCPAHDDRNPSLSISEGSEGQALVHCHAGCAVDEVMRAIRLEKRDLFSVAGDTSRVFGRVKPQSVAVANVKRNETKDAGRVLYPDPDEAQRTLERRIGVVAHRWEYHDSQGELVGLILRFECPDGKVIRPVSRTADGAGWIIGGMPSPRPLYALREIIDSVGAVYVCEGEKACDAAIACGLIATTSPHGSKSASKADWSSLRGRRVIIIPDHDDPGEAYAADVLGLALDSGAASVQIINLGDRWGGLQEGGDLADVLEIEGGDTEAVCAGIETLVAMSEVIDENDEIVEHAEPITDPLAFAPFPIECFPEPVRTYVVDGAAAIGCDASFIALPMLAALASAIGNTHLIQLKKGWTEPAIVWTAVVGESGTAKSPAIQLAVQFVRDRQIADMRVYQHELTLWENEHAIWDAKQSQWKRDASRGKQVDPIPEPSRPTCPRTWTDDATIEALVGKLKENPRGLLMVRDELAGWFSFDRYSSGKGGGEVARWLELFGGRELIVDRKTSDTEFVPRASVSIAGGIQPEILRKSLTTTNRENGLLARLLFAMPPRMQKRWTDTEIDESIERAVERMFSTLYTLDSARDSDHQSDPQSESESEPRIMTLSVSAKQRFIRFVNDHGSEQMGMVGDQAAAWSKLEGYAARFALIFHLTRIASGDRSIEDPTLVDLESLEAGITLMRWFANEANRVYAMLLGQSALSMTSANLELVAWIRSQGNSTTVRDLSRGPRAYRNTATAQAAIDELHCIGLGRWESSNGGRVMRFSLID
tara:strand:- start:41187 stop:43577 length:2391 start_codon:yes stop_codon:yes gene_type:complete